jgi:glucuronokinase
LLPPLYLSYHTDFSEPTEVFHNDIRGRFNRGEAKVVGAMKHCADLAAKGRQALLRRDYETLGRLINENFDTRRSIYTLPPWQVEMIEAARRCGASAQFSGSGGAIVGIYQGEAMFRRLSDRLAALHCRTIKPQVVP